MKKHTPATATFDRRLVVDVLVASFLEKEVNIDMDAISAYSHIVKAEEETQCI